MFAAVTWILLALSYLLFAGQVSWHEIIAGAGASLAAAVYAAIGHRMVESPMGLRLPWDRLILGVAKSLAVDTVRVGLALLRPSPGAMSREALPPADRAPSGRRAVAILAMSVAPNGYVVRARNDQALLHQLVRTERRQARK